jgi:hypothetical protein
LILRQNIEKFNFLDIGAFDASAHMLSIEFVETLEDFFDAGAENGEEDEEEEHDGVGEDVAGVEDIVEPTVARVETVEGGGGVGA